VECPFGNQVDRWTLDRLVVEMSLGMMVDNGHLESHGMSIWTDPTWASEIQEFNALSGVCPWVTEVVHTYPLNFDPLMRRALAGRLSTTKVVSV
jgi:hypothetical protein